MEIRLAENIRTFRKQHSLTQEQLAEVLGVSTGAVYKWEANLSTPELSLILEMADFFDTSVDVLLGYKMKDNRLTTAIARLWELNSNKDRRGLGEAEKALKKYPHNLQVVNAGAFMYMNFGLEEHDRALLFRALELFEQSLLLFDQNTDPMGDKCIIYQNMAAIYVELGDIEKALHLLQSHNPGGINSDQLGLILAVNCKDYKAALPCLSHSLLTQVSVLFNTSLGFARAFQLSGDYRSAKAVIHWAMKCMSGLRNPKGPSYVDKINSIYYVCLACVELKTDGLESAEASLEKAVKLAEQFDSRPNYHPDSFRFATETEWTFAASDSFGKTALESLARLVELIDDETLTKIWAKNKAAQ